MEKRIDRRKRERKKERNMKLAKTQIHEKNDIKNDRSMKYTK